MPQNVLRRKQLMHQPDQHVWTTHRSSIIPQLRGGDTTNYSSTMQTLLNSLELFGTAVFAFSGAVTAGKVGMDLLGMTIVSIVTATGGGSVRDMLLNAGPVFWVQQPVYLYICCITTLVTYVTWPWLERKWGYKDSDKTICIADAVGLAAFVVLTTEKGNVHNLPALYWVVLGLISCTFGGIIRDVLCARPARVMFPNRTLYATPVLLGSTVYTFCKNNKLARTLLNDDQTAALTFFVTLLVRLWAFDNPIRLPQWRSNNKHNKKMETPHEKEHYS